MSEWTFDSAAVAEHFDAYVREQLPWYDLATEVVAHIGRHYITDGGRVYDLGAATGNVGRALAGILEARDAELVALERSEEMIAKYDGPGIPTLADITTTDYRPFDLAVSFLTLMFVPPYKRDALLVSLFGACREGGAVLFVEKYEAPGGYLGTVIRRMTLAGKVAAGVTPASIVGKELSLSGVQRPVAPPIIGTPLFQFGEFIGSVWEPAL